MENTVAILEVSEEMLDEVMGGCCAPYCHAGN